MLTTWQVFFGAIRLNSEVIEATQTFADASNNMQTVISRPNLISKTLQTDWAPYWSCNDDFFEYSEKLSDANIRVYIDTRWTPKRTLDVDPTQRLCSEGADNLAYSFFNVESNQDEIIICEQSWENYVNAQGKYGRLADLDNTAAYLNRFTIDYVADRAAATTILHELTHTESIFGDGAAVDVDLDGEPVYGFDLIQSLAIQQPEVTVTNAVLKLWAKSRFVNQAMYYSGCNWTKRICGQAPPDKIRTREQDGTVTYKTFEY
ncbi:uncharacterized protein ACLA_071280 [Aspergillus clavatus NRRL 1]|uniref:Lysine-specific metallo-endopeptidase domain-containing protein n=1 Tax=Aspergillus clavatus (strain ATCC 1007 / CBS 513.65 / DSM 816 / NCTC 3887 / NRRL 1 / QM 1276 / 107) TaxID=344612 RepID=A1C6S4_ASPCL|nr:uncharacterized protein ACLA_071280 [Aspergillus clavatus NRRL 1]EAW14095.1 hypothetical protein ACLA_071280 [Aspergillus clavatus NRRL 1]